MYIIESKGEHFILPTRNTDHAEAILHE